MTMRRLFTVLTIACWLGTAACAHGDVSRRLYVADNVTGDIRIFDIDHGHKLIKRVVLKADDGKPLVGFIEGMTCHVGSHRLYMSDSVGEQIIAYDLLTDKAAWVKPFKTPPGKKFWHLDRLSVTDDGKLLFVPCRGSDMVLVVDAENGELVDTLRMPGNPHNSFVGERGRYVYVAGRSSRVLDVIDPTTHRIVACIPGFSSPIRPMCASPDENYVFAQVERMLGFTIADVRGSDPGRWKTLMVVEHPRPQRVPRDACSPHTGHPEGHGIAVRPGTHEVWFLDDHYGFLYIYDFSGLPRRPRYKGLVRLFTDYRKPWTDETFRWITFSIDGRYCYAPNGWVIDAAARKDTGMRFTPGEKELEIDFRDGVPFQNGGQNGGVYH